MMCNFESIMVACHAVPAMLNILKYNMTPNAGVASHKSYHQNVEYRIIIKLQQFTGILSEKFIFYNCSRQL